MGNWLKTRSKTGKTWATIGSLGQNGSKIGKWVNNRSNVGQHGKTLDQQWVKHVPKTGNWVKTGSKMGQKWVKFWLVCQKWVTLGSPLGQKWVKHMQGKDKCVRSGSGAYPVVTPFFFLLCQLWNTYCQHGLNAQPGHVQPFLSSSFSLTLNVLSSHFGAPESAWSRWL